MKLLKKRKCRNFYSQFLYLSCHWQITVRRPCFPRHCLKWFRSLFCSGLITISAGLDSDLTSGDSFTIEDNFLHQIVIFGFFPYYVYLLVYNVFLILIDIFMVIHNFKPSVIFEKGSNPNYGLKVVIRAFQRGCARNRQPCGWNGGNANGPTGTECWSCLPAPRIERKKMRQPASSLAMWILSLGNSLREPVSPYLRNEPMMDFFGLRPKYWRL